MRQARTVVLHDRCPPRGASPARACKRRAAAPQELAREAARGVHFYITNQVSSNHLVTDTNGKLVCKYVYEPYGKMNMNLTDTDPDKDGVQFVALKKFTGQEYDYETGLYNYNARLYDQETGRFLQPDPVHSEHVGYDNYDRYQYVHSNPVNFTDPTGETANGDGIDITDAVARLSVLLTQGWQGVRRIGDALTLHQGKSAGRYQGPGAVGTVPFGKESITVWLVSALVLEEKHPGTVAAVLFWVWWDFNYGSPPGLSEVDEHGKVHDRDGPTFMEAKHTRANNKWIRSANSHWLGGVAWQPFPIPTSKMIKDTYAREYAATPEWYGSMRRPVATVNTAFTITGDWLATKLGTALFMTTNGINYINEAGKRAWDHYTSQGTYRIHKARFRLRISGGVG